MPPPSDDAPTPEPAPSDAEDGAAPWARKRAAWSEELEALAAIFGDGRRRAAPRAPPPRARAPDAAAAPRARLPADAAVWLVAAVAPSYPDDPDAASRARAQPSAAPGARARARLSAAAAAARAEGLAPAAVSAANEWIADERAGRRRRAGGRAHARGRGGRRRQ